MALTTVAIKNAKSRTKPYKLADSDGPYLLVTPAGARCWRMNYRHLGKQKTLAFGVWPDTGLAGAREQRDAARKVLARGDDPAEKIKLERIAAEGGMRLMQAGSPRAWTALTQAADMQHHNREAIDQCRKAADKAAKAVRCSIEIGPALRS